MGIAKCIYRVSQGVFFVVLKLFFRLEIKGKENIPQKGPVILVANHFSLLDPFVVTCCTDRIIHWLVASWVFRIKPFSFFAKRIPFLKVEPGKGNNKEALKQAMSILRDGRVIGVFPEGKLAKNGGLNPFFSGTAYLGIKSKVPIIPLYINGSGKLHKISVFIGEEFSFDGIYDPANKEHLAECSLFIRHRIEELKNGADDRPKDLYSIKTPC